jgi:hypothetical protein
LLARRRRRSRRAYLHPRIVTNNHARRAVMAAPAAEVVVGNARQPVITPASTVVITATGPETTGIPSVRVWPTWPKLKRKSPHYFWPMPAQCCGPKEKRVREKP